MMDILLKTALTVGLLCLGSEGKITCKNESDKEVDWYILYKKNNGVEYFYIGPGDTEFKFFNSINEDNGVLANTLQPYFKPPDRSGYIAYSDQPPDADAKYKHYGHSKGVVILDKETGIWLLHSTPKFPEKQDKDAFYPGSGKRNAQIFICVTFKYGDFKHIGEHLKNIHAFPFAYKIPNGGFHKALQDVTNKQYSDPNELKEPHHDFKSEAGQTFKSFVKKTSEDEEPEEGDLYVTIAEGLKSNLNIQTWHSKPGGIMKNS
ncbi:plancitoxin-1-like [Parambassis ranga]|uniref:Deoxyribonuclease-2-alpha n=1 Tax=Parambassis ranga TaxID=210632 RepID=A0A6P7I0R9_9TELE|nr:plancitoxin-1-like [Parambassis ranga]